MLSRLVREIYDSIDNSDMGKLTDADIDMLYLIFQDIGESLQIIVLLSAAQALIFPQINTESVDSSTQAIKALKKMLLTKEKEVTLTNFHNLIESREVLDRFGSRQVEARRCLGHALSFCLEPSQLQFRKVIKSLDIAQREELEHPNISRQRWINWLDRIVTRSDRFDLNTVLGLVEQTTRGTLDLPITPYAWEGAGCADEPYCLDVWIENPVNCELVVPVLVFLPITIKERNLIATVTGDLNLVRDRLRIEYFFEDVIHNKFLGGMYEGRYDSIRYQGVGERWSVLA